MMDRLRVAVGKTRPADYTLGNLRGDAFGGILSGVLLLPVAISCSIIAGVSITVGIFGAAAFGLVASLFGGLGGAIYGPTIISAVITAGVTAKYGSDFSVLMILSVMAGLFSLAFGLLRLGSFITYIPYMVLSGFITASGIFLIVLELPPLFGAAKDADSLVGTLPVLAEAVANVNFHALAISAISFAAFLLWRGRLDRAVSALLVALVIGTAAGMLWFRDAPTIDDVAFGLPSIAIPDLPLSLALGLIQPAFGIALLNAAFTLFVAPIMDSITGSRHQPNRVLIGQGAGYIAGGMIGGLPGGITYLGFANIRCGGRTLLAGILAVSVVVGATVGFNLILTQIPLAVLSAILIKIGWGLIDWRLLKRLNRISPYHVATLLITILVALLVDLTLSVLVGLAVFGLVNSRMVENVESQQLISVPVLDRLIMDGKELAPDADPFEARVGLVRFPDRLTVASAHETLRLIGPDLAGHQIIILDFSRTYFLDDTAAYAIGELISIAVEAQSKRCVICGLSDGVAKSLDSMGVLDIVPQEHIVSDITAARQAVRWALADD